MVDFKAVKCVANRDNDEDLNTLCRSILLSI